MPDSAPPPSALFRAQALEAMSASLGSALAAAPVSWSAVTLFLLVSLCALIGFAGVAGVSRSEHAQGWLEPVGGSVRVLPPRAGILGDLAVRDGDIVVAGQTLFAVRTAEVIGDGLTTVEAEMRASLRHEAGSLEDRDRAERAGSLAEQDQIAARIHALDSRIDSLDAQRSIQVERVAASGERARKAADLNALGVMTETEYGARQDSWLRQKQDLAALDSQLAALRAERVEAIGQADRAKAEMTGRLAQLQTMTAELRTKESEIAVRGGQFVTAPIAGRVTALQAENGQAVDPSHPVLAIVPVGTTFEAELLVPSRAIGFVLPGQRVRLAYDAFPFERFGVYWGTVVSVSEVVLRPDDVRGPIRPAGPSYRARVRLDRGDVDAMGRVVPLQPEMELSADILLERRSIAHWLMQPLLEVWRRA